MRGNTVGAELSNEIAQLLDTTGTPEAADAALIARRASDAFDVIMGSCDYLLNAKSSSRIKVRHYPFLAFLLFLLSFLSFLFFPSSSPFFFPPKLP